MKYNLNYFINVSFNGFDFVVPEDVVKTISSLSMEVGSPSYIRTPVFKKKLESRDSSNLNSFTNKNFQGSSGMGMGMFNNNNYPNRKRRGNRGMEISNEEWETLRIFQPTKIEKKTGIDSQIDEIRFMLNKLTDKTYEDISKQILDIINDLVTNETLQEDMIKIGNFIFEAASTNKFYSKIYANLYAKLIDQHEFLRLIFERNYATYMELFQKIESGDPDKDYDRFCEINKVNEKRKAISMFFINLTSNHVISTNSIVEILRNLLVTVLGYINEDNKKNEVDEITENICILYKKDTIEQMQTLEVSSLDETLNDAVNVMIDGSSITDVIKKLATSKSKDYKSLSNKSIFKYMDLVEM